MIHHDDVSMLWAHVGTKRSWKLGLRSWAILCLYKEKKILLPLLLQNHSFAIGFEYVNDITPLETIKKILPSSYTHWEKNPLTSQD